MKADQDDDDRVGRGPGQVVLNQRQGVVEGEGRATFRRMGGRSEKSSQGEEEKRQQTASVDMNLLQKSRHDRQVRELESTAKRPAVDLGDRRAPGAPASRPSDRRRRR